jgi:hypothetical protein
MSEDYLELKTTLNSIRKKLLDLSKRNRLLNFKETAQSIRIIDELPNNVYETLVQDNKKMSLLPIEEDDEILETTKDVSYEDFIRKAISSLKICDDKGIHFINSGFRDAFKKYYEIQDPLPVLKALSRKRKIIIKPHENSFILYLPEDYQEVPQLFEDENSIDINDNLPSDYCNIPDKHSDLCLQTSYSPRRLERRCKRLHKTAQTAIEETGSNLLYLAIGFLEWYEETNSDISLQAPLILIPVYLERAKIDRKTNCYNYLISYTGEDIETNLSLHEKLYIDFDLILPELDESANPEDYLTEVSQLISSQRKWRVKREMIIGMFSL